MKKEYVLSGAAILASITVITVLFVTQHHKPDNIIDLDTRTEDSAPASDTAKAASANGSVFRQTLDLSLDTSALANEKMPQLQIAEILVSPGQQIRTGTPLIRLTPDSVKNARTALQKEIITASQSYELLKTEQRQTRLQVSQTYDSYVTDGKYSDTVYSSKCDALQRQTDHAKQAVDEIQNQINENLLELAQLQQELVKAQQYLRDAENAVSENYKDRYQNAYNYVVYENTRETAQGMVEQLEEQVRLRTEQNETLLYEADEAVRAYHQVVLEQEKEKLAAKTDHDTEIYYSETAAEWRDIQTAGLDHALQRAREQYETALQNIRNFDDHIVHNSILSGHSGTISDIVAESGDYVMQNDTLVIFAPPPVQSQP